jgi:hypothetical protein
MAAADTPIGLAAVSVWAGVAGVVRLVPGDKIASLVAKGATTRLNTGAVVGELVSRQWKWPPRKINRENGSRNLHEAANHSP